MRKSDFHYPLPPRLIAQTPLPERGGSRLLCLSGENGTVADRQFADLPGLLKPGDLLVFNDTRVMPARLFGHKASGGKIELLIERVLDAQTALAQIRASKPPRPGGELLLDGGHPLLVIDRQGDLFVIQSPGLAIMELLDAIGHIPLPPYIARADATEDRERYQTVFAQNLGAVAAPTAGLHFDQPLLHQLGQAGVQQTFVTLHVGSGTFQPLRTENLDEHNMHEEYCELGPAAVNAIAQTKASGGRVVGVGTTVARTLESAALAGAGELKPFRGHTRLFICPGFQFRCTDVLLTNFHLPESTLLALVCAFAGYAEVMAAYAHAVRQEYRFFSYGDAMLLTRKPAEPEEAV